MARPTWTRKTYEMVAEKIRINAEEARRRYPDSLHGDMVLCGMEDIAVDLADQFCIDNPNFDRAKFLSACGF